MNEFIPIGINTAIGTYCNIIGRDNTIEEGVSNSTVVGSGMTLSESNVILVGIEGKEILYLSRDERLLRVYGKPIDDHEKPIENLLCAILDGVSEIKRVFRKPKEDSDETG